MKKKQKTYIGLNFPGNSFSDISFTFCLGLPGWVGAYKQKSELLLTGRAKGCPKDLLLQVWPKDYQHGVSGVTLDLLKRNLHFKKTPCDLRHIDYLKR